MRKEEFFDKLEYLLQDIPDQDREDALAYYRDYLAEAGSGNEEAAIEDFGSPERVAAIIRADLAGNLNDGGSFTDRGYRMNGSGIPATRWQSGWICRRRGKIQPAPAADAGMRRTAGRRGRHRGAADTRTRPMKQSAKKRSHGPVRG